MCEKVRETKRENAVRDRIKDRKREMERDNKEEETRKRDIKIERDREISFLTRVQGKVTKRPGIRQGGASS